MKRRSCVPKGIKREQGKVPYSKTFSKEVATKQPMRFNQREARKRRPAQNKGRGIQGGYWGHK